MALQVEGIQNMGSISRREFVRLGVSAAAAGAAVKTTLLEPLAMAAQSPANDAGRKIRFVSIGTGIRGCDLLRSARQVPNGVLVGTADLYDMHQKAGLEAYGADVPDHAAITALCSIAKMSMRSSSP